MIPEFLFVRQAVEDEAAKKVAREASSRTGRFLETFREEFRKEMQKKIKEGRR